MATDLTRKGHAGSAPSTDGQADDQDALSAKAARCRRLAAGISDSQAADVLTSMARTYQAAADRLGTQG